MKKIEEITQWTYILAAFILGLLLLAIYAHYWNPDLEKSTIVVGVPTLITGLTAIITGLQILKGEVFKQVWEAFGEIQDLKLALYGQRHKIDRILQSSILNFHDIKRKDLLDEVGLELAVGASCWKSIMFFSDGVKSDDIIDLQNMIFKYNQEFRFNGSSNDSAAKTLEGIKARVDTVIEEIERIKLVR